MHPFDGLSGERTAGVRRPGVRWGTSEGCVVGRLAAGIPARARPVVGARQGDGRRVGGGAVMGPGEPGRGARRRAGAPSVRREGSAGSATAGRPGRAGSDGRRTQRAGLSTEVDMPPVGGETGRNVHVGRIAAAPIGRQTSPLADHAVRRASVLVPDMPKCPYITVTCKNEDHCTATAQRTRTAE
ncbi:hypothetical protein TOK_3324 [Pseudonocardia sp. N23]|nr:hypothetical protein TOK_3324 [Pseudonocardia sp. N23]